ncbi:hypothetical protein [Acetobacterium sp. UBA5834]|uniref:hypothetical protein n=1 Tax=Acetobacterium sp. UBA5834 TaxID=1945907 RepID=UPI00257DA1AB|nr:hypothetical protein [Acetobacterium sp. UBA5834]
MDKIDKLIKEAMKISPTESVFMAFIEENDEGTGFQLRVNFWKGKPGTFTRSVETLHKTVEEAEAHLETLEAKAPVIFIQWGLGD